MRKSHHGQFLLSMIFKVKYESQFVPADAMKAYRVVEVYLHFFLISDRDGREYSASRHGRCTSRGKAIEWEVPWAPEPDSTFLRREKSFAFPGFKPQFLYIGEISPTRCNNCVFYSQWLYSTCFG